MARTPALLTTKTAKCTVPKVNSETIQLSAEASAVATLSEETFSEADFFATELDHAGQGVIGN